MQTSIPLPPACPVACSAAAPPAPAACAPAPPAAAQVFFGGEEVTHGVYLRVAQEPSVAISDMPAARRHHPHVQS
jgi:hypothetical protein